VASGELIPQPVCQSESDLLILADGDVAARAGSLLAQLRSDLEAYIRRDPRFLTARTPHPPLPDAPLVARRMAEAAKRYGVGPMAAVAGAIAEGVGEQLAGSNREVVVENGGDIYVRCRRPVVFTLYAGGDSPFSGRLRFGTRNTRGTMGVCTSSGTVGHSFSRGRADAVCVIARSTPLADAAATALANRVQNPEDIDPILEIAAADDSILGLLAAFGDRLGIWGDVEIV
jgi:ApbE superfamily uncharacterized protein (UPF0280 family)